MAMFSKKDLVDIKKESISISGRYKRRELVIHPTLLSYDDKVRVTQSPDVLLLLVNPARKLHPKHDFLLAPLGNTEITEVGETILLLVSKTGANGAVKQVTLKFEDPIVRQD